MMQENISEKLDVELSRQSICISINSSGITSAGFKEIMKRMSLMLMMIAGDSATDVLVFKVARTSVALGNASDDVKSEANVVVSAKAEMAL